MALSLHQKGFSLVEVLLAGALFTILAWVVTDGVLTSLEMDRTGNETTIATEFAREGIEAVRALKEAHFEDMAESSGTGIGEHDGFLAFSGTQDAFEQYTRVIQIQPGRRDSDGALVESGGERDPDTFRVTVTVSWKPSPSRDNSVVLETYMTHFQ